MTNSVDKKNSRYVQGGDTEVYANRLGWHERYQFAKSDDDLFITLNSVQSRRPDKLAYEIYQDASLMWLVLQYNDILDYNTEFVTGVEIRLPKSSRVKSEILTRSTGGKDVT